LTKELKRTVDIGGKTYVVTLSASTLKISLKGHRLGLELPWKELVSGEQALAVALRASLGRFDAAIPPKRGKMGKANAPMAAASGASKKADSRVHLPVHSPKPAAASAKKK